MHYFLSIVINAACGIALLVSSLSVANEYQVFLIRHAEKVVSSSADPELSECGKLQAKALSTLFAELQLPQLFHTPYLRTTMTATALLQHGRSLQPYEPSKLAALARQLLDTKQSAVVVGHSNTTPQLAALLSGQEMQPMSDQQYGMIYQLIFSDQQFILLNQMQLPQPAGCPGKP